MATDQYWLGFDLGGTKMLAIVYNDDFEKVGKSIKVPTNAKDGKKKGLKRIVETAKEALKSADIPDDQLSGVGIGCPGPIHVKTGTLIHGANLGWSNVKIGETLEDALDCPAVVTNDVDAGVYGEYRFGAGKSVDSLLGVFPGTGIGAGAVFNDTLIQGNSVTCMELGHLPIGLIGDSCGCGGEAHLETVASRLAIAAQAITAARQGRAPNLLEECGTDISAVKSGALARAIAAGDEDIRAIVERAATWLGRGVAATVNLLAPEMIVLGGGMVEAMEDLFVTEVTRSANEAVMPTFRDTFEVVAAELQDDATVLGAAAYARRKILAGG